MKKIALRILLLFAIFIGSLIIFMLMLNRHDSFSTKSMAEATLPVLYMNEDGVTVNRMYGYRQEVNETSLRDSLTPVSFDRNLTVEIQSKDIEVKGAGYQVTLLEDGSLVENGRLSLNDDSGKLTSDFTLSNAIAVDQEYMLRFSVDIGEDEPVYYYTRLVQDSGQTLSYYLEYAEAFCQGCINNNLTDEMISQLETESSHVNSSLHYVTLKSDIEQITWGELEPVLVKKAVPSILEVNETTVSIGMEYVVSAQNEEGEKEYYSAVEYYRMRRSRDEVILLDYERTVTQFFDGNLPVLTEDGINLGVTGSDLEYAVNPQDDIAAFVQAGELWQYDRYSNKVSRLFSFRDELHTDERYGNNSYDISISSVSEEGNTTFIVYGYMSAGDHEGNLGICIYRYYAENNTTREILFIPLQDSYQMMAQGLSKLSYVNGNGQCFLYYGDTIYSIRLSDTPEFSVLQDELDWQTISVSDSQTLVSWGEGSGLYAEALNELNLETGAMTSINAPDGDYIRTLGFVGEDLVYGVAHEEDCYTDSSGNTIFPMYKVSIVNPGGETVRDYQENGIYVTSASVENGLITLKRAEYNENGRLSAVSDDQILYYAPAEGSYVRMALRVSERNGTQVHFVFSASGETANLLNMDTRYPSDSSAGSFEMPQLTYKNDRYLVYAHGSLYALYKNLSSAVSAADENMGVVLGTGQDYVWERGNIKTSMTIEPSSVPQGFLSALVGEEAAAAAVGSGYEVLNFTGCSLEAVKYQISRGYAVAGQWSPEETVLILGYDIYDNIWLYNSETGEAEAVAGEEAQAAFEENGNVFISYSKN
jgi:hypothetical protein